MSEPRRAERASHIEWVPIGKMRVSPSAQRDFRSRKAEHYAADFSFDKLGLPVLSHRGEDYWIVDGQHRIGALKLIGFGSTDLVECEVYDALTESQEAEMFLGRDDRTKVTPFDAFRIALTAGRGVEHHIADIVEREGCKISRGTSEGCIGAVGALRFAYDRGGPRTLARMLHILASAYDRDTTGLGEQMLRGMALVCQRYDGTLDDEKAIQHLGTRVGGPLAILRRAAVLQHGTGRPRADCVAAAFVDTLNGRGGGHKLESWWK